MMLLPRSGFPVLRRVMLIPVVNQDAPLSHELRSHELGVELRWGNVLREPRSLVRDTPGSGRGCSLWEDLPVLLLLTRLHGFVYFLTL